MEQVYTKEELNKKIIELQVEVENLRKKRDNIISEEYKNKVDERVREFLNANKIAIFRTVPYDDYSNKGILYIGYLYQNVYRDGEVNFKGVKINYTLVYDEDNDYEDEYEIEIDSFDEIYTSLTKEEVDGIELFDKYDSVYCDFKDYVNSLNTYLLQ